MNINRQGSHQKLRAKLFVASWAVVVIGISVSGFLGCKRGLVPVPVKGEVKLNGKPVADCGVAFMPVEGGPTASATTNAEGQFELQTVNRPGAVLGEHRITIVKQRMLPSKGIEFNFQFLTPPKYAHPDTSGFQETVSNETDQNHFVLEMSSRRSPM